MRTFLCTTGTSIANPKDCPAISSYQREWVPWETPTSELDQQIEKRLQSLNLSVQADRVRASAELNSLHRLNVAAEDTVILLATDTAEGRACAEAIKRTLIDHFGLPQNQVRVERIVGLQVRDAQTFRAKGIPELTRVVLRTIEQTQARHSGEELILNPTGGFKGVVPFLTILGMLFKLRTVYVFEFSETLINLPPIPVTFDLDLYNRARPALDLIEEETAIPLERYFKNIDAYQPFERELFTSFIEIVDREATHSELTLILRGIEDQGSKNIRLSPMAKSSIERSTGDSRERLERIVGKIAQPLWRTSHYHVFKGTDLIAAKPGSVAERAAWFIEGETVYVCCLYLSHDEYERDLPKRQKSHFPVESFCAWPLP